MASEREVFLKDVRLSFPDLWKATKVNPSSSTEVEKYRATFLVEKDSAHGKAMLAAAKAAGKEKWGAKFEDASFRKSLEMRFLKDGDDKARWSGFEGMDFVPASNPKRVPVFGRDRAVLVESDGKPYAGCYVNARVEVWAQDNAFGKALNVSLLGVQFRRDGDSFGGGGRVAGADEFDDLEDEGVEPAAASIEDDPLG